MSVAGSFSKRGSAIWVACAVPFCSVCSTKVQVGSSAPLTVAATTTVASVPAAMPVGDLPGWHQVTAEDFTTPVALGGWLSSPYTARWFAYDGYGDTSGHGVYDPAKVLSVHDGTLDWYLHTENGSHLVAALVPGIPATGWGQRYGRYSVRFRSDTIPGYKMVAMLWPDSDNWGEGEVDFTEVGELTAGNTIYANMYSTGDTSTGTPGSSRA